MAAGPEPRWFKSSYSGGSGTECVECAYGPDGALIRDSKRADGPTLDVRLSSWRLFIDAVRHGAQPPS
ncbi:DUF397 domain-containing protein [Streptomyces tendae]|uniref:DUF397 domain-containing protein n=1 Tax=Streptomyces tendae TaxID=1932 RepID=A0A6B3QID9_STRTE|nr:DUF397 domain-containing protein [Streptomyces sp. RK74B]MBQ1005144.1 DUF397 domain-containing protein [Streptomyces sp. RK23]MZG16480.1 DUF397 domain-containing protein [Streptomyces sp. SID5914]NEV86627.1 DUF397 domain-containing protein [Streptomyces tendae]